MPKTLKNFVAEARAQITEVSPEQLRDERTGDADLLLVDVREPGEYSGGHIEGALSIPRGIIEPAADLEFPHNNPELAAARERRVIVYCATGGRSAMAAVVLQQMGFTNVASVAGGMGAWTQAGLEVAT